MTVILPQLSGTNEGKLWKWKGLLDNIRKTHICGQKVHFAESQALGLIKSIADYTGPSALEELVTRL